MPLKSGKIQSGARFKKGICRILSSTILTLACTCTAVPKILYINYFVVLMKENQLYSYIKSNVLAHVQYCTYAVMEVARDYWSRSKWRKGKWIGIRLVPIGPNKELTISFLFILTRIITWMSLFSFHMVDAWSITIYTFCTTVQYWFDELIITSWISSFRSHIFWYVLLPITTPISLLSTLQQKKKITYYIFCAYCILKNLQSNIQQRSLMKKLAAAIGTNRKQTKFLFISCRVQLDYWNKHFQD